MATQLAVYAAGTWLAVAQGPGAAEQMARELAMQPKAGVRVCVGQGTVAVWPGSRWLLPPATSQHADVAPAHDNCLCWGMPARVHMPAVEHVSTSRRMHCAWQGT